MARKRKMAVRSPRVGKKVAKGPPETKNTGGGFPFFNPYGGMKKGKK